MTTVGPRTSDHEIEPLFLGRWSPRAFSGEAIPQDVLMRIFEAARWAPSSYNSQPWRFVYARRDTPNWEPMLSLLNDMNRSWSKDAAVIIVMASSSTMQPSGADKPVPSYSHSFDAGSAWGYLALQATTLGWPAHGLVGFDKERAFSELGFPEGFRVECAIAVGKIGDKAKLPEALQAREAPNGRKPLAETVFEPRQGGHIYDRGVDGSECRWARVLAYEPPTRVVFSWDISLQWQIESDPQRTSEVEVRFITESPQRTRVELEHRNLDRHGDGWEQMREAVASPGGWPLGLARFAAVTS